MMLVGASSAKRTMMFGNLPTMGLLNTGRLTKAMREQLTTVTTTRAMPQAAFGKVQSCGCWEHLYIQGRYTDSQGVKRFQGKKSELKHTQLLYSKDALMTSFDPLGWP